MLRELVRKLARTIALRLGKRGADTASVPADLGAVQVERRRLNAEKRTAFSTARLQDVPPPEALAQEIRRYVPDPLLAQSGTLQAVYDKDSGAFVLNGPPPIIQWDQNAFVPDDSNNLGARDDRDDSSGSDDDERQDQADADDKESREDASERPPPGSEPQEPQDQEPQDQEPQDQEPQDQEPQDQEPQDQEPQDQKPQDQEPQDQEPQDQEPQGQEPQDQEPQGQEPQDQEPQDQEQPEESDVEQKALPETETESAIAPSSARRPEISSPPPAPHALAFHAALMNAPAPNLSEGWLPEAPTSQERSTLAPVDEALGDDGSSGEMVEIDCGDSPQTTRQVESPTSVGGAATWAGSDVDVPTMIQPDTATQTRVMDTSPTLSDSTFDHRSQTQEYKPVPVWLAGMWRCSFDACAKQRALFLTFFAQAVVNSGWYVDLLDPTLLLVRVDRRLYVVPIPDKKPPRAIGRWFDIEGNPADGWDWTMQEPASLVEEWPADVDPLKAPAKAVRRGLIRATSG